MTLTPDGWLYFRNEATGTLHDRIDCPALFAGVAEVAEVLAPFGSTVEGPRCGYCLASGRGLS